MKYEQPPLQHGPVMPWKGTLALKGYPVAMFRREPGDH